ncbi:MAG: hypothetical protein K8F91_01870, partial [Candidatus Obscuribacterales bacterium]|nr:hypothetical protein [Candidatus Obscuribacterales bacterium]
MSTPIDTSVRHGIVEVLQVPGNPEGPLAGTTFVVKDLFDVKGTTTGVGNPHWRLTHLPAAEHAPVVTTLLNAGANLSGKALTDEFACSLDGINEHFPIPLNPLYPERIPGGSSSGSASCVASGIVDFALGTDTVGSTRVPAAYCGIYGFRPSHGSVPLDGVQPLGPSFDTVGWFSQTAELLERVGSLLLDSSSTGNFSKLKIVDSAFDLVEKDFRADLGEKATQSGGSFESWQSFFLDTHLLDTCSQLF